MMYMGSTVVYGRGKAVICGTGMNTKWVKSQMHLHRHRKEKLIAD